MRDGTLEAVLRRDRLIVGSALGVITALAWSYVLWLAADMNMHGMNMSPEDPWATGFRMVPAGMGMMAPAAAPWSAVEFSFVFAMWAVMMVGMMAPSAAPMILMYARVGPPPGISWPGPAFPSRQLLSNGCRSGSPC
jgi:predicted metal-binding membrane protein